MASMGLCVTMKQIIDPLKNVTLVILPIVLPLLLGGVDVNPMDIAGSLIVLMLIPLAIGLFILMPIAGEIGKRSQAT